MTKNEVGSIITNVPQAGRVPCKLNNERNEKHQTGALKSARKAWGSGVQSITRGTKYKKVFEAMTNSSVKISSAEMLC